MNRFALQQSARCGASSSCLNGVTFHVLIVLSRRAMAGDMKEGGAFWAADSCHVCIAKSGDRFHKRVENRFEIKGRATNHFENVSSRGLLLKRFAQFIEQPRILDGDDGLV